MRLEERYTQMWDNGLAHLSSGQIETDTLIDQPNEDRRGITLIARLDQPVGEKINSFLEEVKLIEPNQYCYPQSDLHLTVLSIISCFSGFSLDQIQVSDYTEQIRRALLAMSDFEIEFTGLTASPSSILIRGFPSDNSLQRIREALRNAFRDTDLMQSMDQRYAIKTAHCTVVRFKNKITNSPRFVDFLNKNMARPFGNCSVRTLDLVFNDWYMKVENTRKLEEFSLMG